MFSKAKKNSRQALANEKRMAPPSIVSLDMRITGDIMSEGDVQVDGRVDGDVVCRTLTVGPTGAVTGEVRVDNARLHGTMVGQLIANSVFLASTARMTGDISHQSLAIEPGAYVDGHCRHMETVAPEEKAAAPAKDEAKDGADEKSEVKAAAKEAANDAPAHPQPIVSGATQHHHHAGGKPVVGQQSGGSQAIKPMQPVVLGDRTPQEAIKGALSGAS